VNETPLDRLILYLENHVATLDREYIELAAKREGIQSALSAARTIRDAAKAAAQ
jgi:hypothetical protein